MGAKYLPTIKDRNADQRFHQNQRRKARSPSPAKPAPAAMKAGHIAAKKLAAD